MNWMCIIGLSSLDETQIFCQTLFHFYDAKFHFIVMIVVFQYERIYTANK